MTGGWAKIVLAAQDRTARFLFFRKNAPIAILILGGETHADAEKIHEADPEAYGQG